MIEMPYRKEKPYDAGFERVMGRTIPHALEDKDDDFLVICTGSTGTGKTRLMLHGYTIYAGEKASIHQVALNRQEFAQSLKNAKDSSVKRFVGYDEANISKRDALSKWNKAVIDLYYAIRGLNILHWWSNPSIEMLDKPFIEERVKGVIFIFTKDKKRPRLYYYLRKDDLLDLLEKYGNLKHRTLKKYAKQHAYYRGWFRDYQGPMLAEYLTKKQGRMEDKVDVFYDEYGRDESLTLATWTAKASVSENTAKKIFNYGLESGLLKEGEHYTRSKIGKVFLTPKGSDELDYIAVNGLYKQGKAANEASEGSVILIKRGKDSVRVSR